MLLSGKIVSKPELWLQSLWNGTVYSIPTPNIGIVRIMISAGVYL